MKKNHYNHSLYKNLEAPGEVRQWLVLKEYLPS